MWLFGNPQHAANVIAAADRDAHERSQGWYTVNCFDSDRFYHHYCGDCYERIPEFMIKWSQRMTPPYLSGGEPVACEGCDKEAPQ